MKRLHKSKENKIREIVGLPNEDIFEAKCVVLENMPSENTFSYAPPVKDGYKALNAIPRLKNRTKKEDSFSDYGASGGASSPNTEVNAENQGIQSEVTDATSNAKCGVRNEE